MNRLLVACCIVATLLLSGCDSRPDDTTIARAVLAQVRDKARNVNDLAQQLGGPSGVRIVRALGSPDPQTLRVAHLKVQNSQRLDNGDYTMTVHYDLVTPQQSQGVTRTIQMRKQPGGWQAVDYQPASTP